MGILSILNRKKKVVGENKEEKEMSFVEHLDELRTHIIRSLLAIGAFSIVVFFLTDFIFRKVLFYPLDKNFPTYQLLCRLGVYLNTDAICFTPVKTSVQTFDMGEAFGLHLKVCIIGGLIIAFPYVLWELWKFIRPGLYEKERRATRSVVAVGSFLFLLGVSFGYFILAPFAINFLVGYQLPMVNESLSIIKAGSYINYMVMFTLPAGLIFELPIVVFYLSKIGILTDRDMRTYRKHSIVVILIIAAIVTPPDVVSQVIVAIPVYLLYELSIGIAAVQTRKREKEISE
jgi:sec-independent protein translocase protein TatC